jgi:hypothetical protein
LAFKAGETARKKKQRYAKREEDELAVKARETAAKKSKDMLKGKGIL